MLEWGKELDRILDRKEEMAKASAKFIPKAPARTAKVPDYGEDFARVMKLHNDLRGAQRDSDYHGDAVLANLYREPTRFILELLQNADDARAKKIMFQLEGDVIWVLHDGAKEFTVDDMHRIANSGYSGKADDETTIGKYGVGFKSVHAVTARPEVYSTTLNFAIEDYVAIRPLAKMDLGEYTTAFRLPLEGALTQKEWLKEKVRTALDELGATDIMFLRHLEEMVIGARMVRLERTEQEGYIEVSDDGKHKFWLFQDDLGGTLAYELNKKSELIKPKLKDISSFFPTTEKSGMNIVVDAPFRLTPDRERINFSLRENQRIIDGLIDLFKQSIRTLVELKKWNAQMMGVVVDMDESVVLGEKFHDVLEKMAKNEQILPTVNGKYVRGREAALAEDKELTELVPDKSWLDVDHDNRDLWHFYSYDLWIHEYSITDFVAQELNEEKLQRKSDDWLKKFYLYLASKVDEHIWGVVDIWKVLQKKPIIKTVKGDFVIPTRAFLPEGETEKRNVMFDEDKVVCEILTSEEYSDETREKLDKLLKNLHVGQQTVLDILSFLYETSWEAATDEKKFEILETTAEAYEKMTIEERHELNLFLRGWQIVPVRKENGKLRWIKPFSEIVYHWSAELKTLFEDIIGISELADEVWTEKRNVVTMKNGRTKTAMSGSCIMWRDLGIEEKMPQPVSIYDGVLRQDGTIDYLKQHDFLPLIGTLEDGVKLETVRPKCSYEIPEMERIIERLTTVELGRTLILQLLELREALWMGKVDCLPEWPLTKPHRVQTIPADYLLRLGMTRWVVDADGTMVRPDEMSREKFKRIYKLPETGKIDKLLKLLAFSEEEDDLMESEDEMVAKLYAQLPASKKKEALEFIKGLL